MIKKIIFLSILSLIISCTSTTEPAEEEIAWVDFEWETHSIRDIEYEKASINIPVSIDGVADDFSMQFDLGANLTMLYGQTFKPYFDAFPDLVNRIDTLNGYPYLTNTTLTLDKEYAAADFSLFYESNFGEVLDETEVGNSAVKHIGTIGANLLKEKVLVIDYPAGRLAILDSIPTVFRKTDENVDITLDRWGRVHLPIQVNGEEKIVLFDTGSSIFTLLTSTSNWEQSTDAIKQDSILTSTWGEYYYTYAADVEKVTLGTTELQDLRLFDAQYLSDFIAHENIWGIMGNAHFFDHTVVVDFKNLKFGLIKNSSE
ncbi:MAG: hypothetical protein AAF433_23030 [Bacteroidota bacterium]